MPRSRAHNKLRTNHNMPPAKRSPAYKSRTPSFSLEDIYWLTFNNQRFDSSVFKISFEEKRACDIVASCCWSSYPEPVEPARNLRVFLYWRAEIHRFNLRLSLAPLAHEPSQTPASGWDESIVKNIKPPCNIHKEEADINTATHSKTLKYKYMQC